MFISQNLHAALTRAVLISLFSWRRAADDDALDDEERTAGGATLFPPLPTIASARVCGCCVGSS